MKYNLSDVPEVAGCEERIPLPVHRLKDAQYQGPPPSTRRRAVAPRVPVQLHLTARTEHDVVLLVHLRRIPAAQLSRIMFVPCGQPIRCSESWLVCGCIFWKIHVEFAPLLARPVFCTAWYPCAYTSAAKMRMMSLLGSCVCVSFHKY